jgi:hypothetical protein
MKNRCLGCGDIAHCGSSCTDCYECSDCECVECLPPKIQIDDEGFPYPTGDD